METAARSLNGRFLGGSTFLNDIELDPAFAGWLQPRQQRLVLRTSIKSNWRDRTNFTFRIVIGKKFLFAFRVEWNAEIIFDTVRVAIDAVLPRAR